MQPTGPTRRAPSRGSVPAGALTGVAAVLLVVAAPAHADVRVRPTEVTPPADVRVTATCPEPVGADAFSRATVRVPELGRVRVVHVVDGRVRTTLALGAATGSHETVTVRVRCATTKGDEVAAGRARVVVLPADGSTGSTGAAAVADDTVAEDPEVSPALPLATLAVVVVGVFVAFGVAGRRRDADGQRGERAPRRARR